MARVLSFNSTSALFDLAKANKFALPAINVYNTNSINACLSVASNVQSPIIIQLSHGGAASFIGAPTDSYHRSSIYGATAAAKYIHEASRLYNAPVLINTDHASSKLVPWVDGLLVEGERFYKREGVPLFTSHMLDLSELPLKQNIEISKSYLERMTELDMYLEIELGVTGGEEDGVDNTNIESSKLYTHPEEVAYAYEELLTVSNNFVIAASFGNVHGVYKPGNVKLQPTILKRSQDLVAARYKLAANPISFVFHGGSGSDRSEIKESLEYGVVKMNLDTDMQWAFWNGVRHYYLDNKEHLESQLGNSSSPDAPNKKYYDPRKWLKQAEQYLSERLAQSFHDLNAMNICQGNNDLF